MTIPEAKRTARIIEWRQLIYERQQSGQSVKALSVYQSRHYRLEDQLLKFFPQQVEQDTQILTGLQKDQATVMENPVPEKHFVGIEIKGKAFSDKETADEAILAVCKLASSKDVELGHYRGFAMRLTYDSMAKRMLMVPTNLHPHHFRHSRAMHLYQHGMELALVSQWLGHANLETTLIYAHADTEMKRRAIEKASSDICEVNARSAVPDVLDDDTLKRLYGLR